MHIGVPRERHVDEHRVGLTPAGVELLTAAGHVCSVESDAGRGAGFSNVDYERAGGRIVYSSEEAHGRADLVFRVGQVTEEEAGWLQPGAIIAGFLHLAARRRTVVETLLEKRITAIAYETIQQDDGVLPVLVPMSQVGGRMVPQVAARLLQNDHGGKGILLGGVPGVPPAEVLIIGAGTVGTAAAHAFLGIGATVYLLDRDLARLQRIDDRCAGGRRPIMMVSHPFNIRKTVKFADVLVGAVLVPGARTPVVVTREMVKSMKPRSVIIDVAIDQGGCVETSRPTTHRDPTFVEEGIIHYCVPTMTSVVARTATHAFNNAMWPFMWEVARLGLDEALGRMPALKRGVATHAGHVVNAALAAHLGVEEVSL
jgi:alanine dehydrogenase